MTPKHPSESLTILTDLVLPSETNPLNNLFGGELLARMDRAASIACGRSAACASRQSTRLRRDQTVDPRVGSFGRWTTPSPRSALLQNRFLRRAPETGEWRCD